MDQKDLSCEEQNLIREIRKIGYGEIRIKVRARIPVTMEWSFEILDGTKTIKLDEK